ncbi:hypothetical protein [Flexithrix dorotheae]|uniref:hypothetical protein n=1 Tax=Flexithrix dorotheae TaxID=70993 RepID=UPI0003708DF9|nr:hypothetical protein [Flexithrix dorotheae]
MLKAFFPLILQTATTALVEAVSKKKDSKVVQFLFKDRVKKVVIAFNEAYFKAETELGFDEIDDDGDGQG